jgi:hypothetical protein
LRILPFTYFSLLFYIYLQIENHICKNVRNKSKLRTKSPWEKEGLRSLPTGNNSTQTMRVSYHVYHITCVHKNIPQLIFQQNALFFILYALSILWPHYLCLCICADLKKICIVCYLNLSICVLNYLQLASSAESWTHQTRKSISQNVTERKEIKMESYELGIIQEESLVNWEHHLEYLSDQYFNFDLKCHLFYLHFNILLPPQSGSCCSLRIWELGL